MEKKQIPKLAVDILITNDNGEIALIKRKFEPFKGMYALPGGFVDYGETVENAAVREAKEETGLDVELQGMLGIYDELGRDPRGHIISIVFIAKQTGGKIIKSSDETEEGGFKSLEEIESIELGSDHNQMIKDYKKSEK